LLDAGTKNIAITSSLILARRRRARPRSLVGARCTLEVPEVFVQVLLGRRGVDTPGRLDIALDEEVEVRVAASVYNFDLSKLSEDRGLFGLDPHELAPKSSPNVCDVLPSGRYYCMSYEHRASNRGPLSFCTNTKY